MSGGIYRCMSATLGEVDERGIYLECTEQPLLRDRMETLRAAAMISEPQMMTVTACLLQPRKGNSRAKIYSQPCPFFRIKPHHDLPLINSADGQVRFVNRAGRLSGLGLGRRGWSRRIISLQGSCSGGPCRCRVQMPKRMDSGLLRRLNDMRDITAQLSSNAAQTHASGHTDALLENEETVLALVWHLLARAGDTRAVGCSIFAMERA